MKYSMLLVTIAACAGECAWADAGNWQKLGTKLGTDPDVESDFCEK